MQKNCEQTGEVYGYRMEAYEVAANTVRVGTTTMRNWVREFETQEFINDSKRGKHSKTESPILVDLEFREEFRAHVKQTSREQGISII